MYTKTVLKSSVCTDVFQLPFCNPVHARPARQNFTHRDDYKSERRSSHSAKCTVHSNVFGSIESENEPCGIFQLQVVVRVLVI